MAALNDFERDISQREGRMGARVGTLGSQLSGALHQLAIDLKKTNDRLDRLEQSRGTDEGGEGRPDAVPGKPRP
jgi:hypothetical protein